MPEYHVTLAPGENSPGPNHAFATARGLAETMDAGAIVRVTIERAALYTDAPPTVEHGAFVADGIGSAVYVSADYPTSRTRPSDAVILALATAARDTAMARKASTDAAVQARLDAISARRLVVGAQWRGAQCYVPGRDGLATFSYARIESIDANGLITVELSMRGSSKQWRIVTDPASRLFDNYPT